MVGGDFNGKRFVHAEFAGVDVIRRISLCAALTWLAFGSSAPAMAGSWEDCLRQKDSDLRIAACNEVIGANNPIRRALAYSIRAQGWRDKGDFSKALSDYDEAIKLDVNDINIFSIYWARGSLLQGMGEYDRAIADYDRVIRFRPKLVQVYLQRGMTWSDKGDTARAIAAYDEVIRLFPKEPNGYNNRGFELQNKGDLDRAIEDQNAAIRLAPADGKMYAMRGKSWQLKGDLDRALADQDKAVALYQKDKNENKGSLIYVYRGDTLRYRGEYARAIADDETALGIGLPDFIPALVGLGLTYEKMGDLTNARTQFERAVASKNQYRSTDVSKSSLATAQARLAALNSGIAQPAIPISLPKATSAT
jgi:tetratricopeptide (TPR) repeat protein